jgi:glycerophosphoryl diester phosphodiesterase
MTLAELQSFDVGRPKPGSLYARTHSRLTPRDGEAMPSLAQVVQAVRAVKADFRLFIEIKTSLKDRTLSARAEDVAEAVVAELRRLSFRSCAILVSFDWAGLIHAKRLDPDVSCWFSTMRGSRRGAKAIRAAGGDGWFRCYGGANAHALKSARAAGLAYGVWTVNAPGAMNSLIAAGVDAICTDRPDSLQALLDQSPSNKAVER